MALAQVLPGPSSSQLGLAVGHLRAGGAGAVAAWAGFTLPSALLMILAAGAWQLWPGADLVRAVHGLLLVALAVVVQAVVSMYQNQCRTPVQVFSAWAAFAFMLVVPSTATLPVALALGAFAGAWADPSPTSGSPPAALQAVPAGYQPRRGPALVALGVFVVLALALPVARAAWGWEPLAWADAFYRTGSWVFGGGHVVLPWLEREVVGPGWVTQEAFLAGYGAAQALPGPLFSLSAYLGMVTGGLPGALVALVAIFLPGALLMLGVLPFWAALRSRPRWRGAFAGASATVVGVLAATVVNPLGSALVTPVDWAVVAGLFLLVASGRVPLVVVVTLGALAGPLASLLS